MNDSAGRARGWKGRAHGRVRHTGEDVRRPGTEPVRGGAGVAPEAKSSVPFCLIKDKLKQQHWKQRRQQAQSLKQCIASMQNLRVSNAVPQTSLGNYNSTSQPSPVAQPDSSLHPSQSGINMKPCDGPPVGALLAAQQVQATAARQTATCMISASDFDFCISCNDKIEKLGFSSVIENLRTYHEINFQELSSCSRLPCIQHCIQFLVHACQCTDANCRLPPICQKIKKIIQHSRSCECPKKSDECLVCRQLFYLCYYHTEYCQEVKCSVPFCLIVKDQLKQQQLQHRQQYAERGVQRHLRIAWQQFLQNLKFPMTPQRHKNALAILKSSPELVALFMKVKKRLQLRQQTSQPSPVAHPDSSLHASQSGIDMKPCNAPPVSGM